MSPWQSSEIELVLLSGEHGLRKVSVTHPVSGQRDHIYKMSSASRDSRSRRRKILPDIAVSWSAPSITVIVRPPPRIKA